ALYHNTNNMRMSYFWKGCMPGADGNLCKVCVGDSQLEGGRAASRCTANHNELYYGNVGALRSYGDVAFLEHSNLSGWAKGYSPSDFELLCLDGSRAAVTEWSGCNLGPIPPSTVMTRPVSITKIYDFLMKSQVIPGENAGDVSLSQKYGESDLLFKDATRYLVHASHMNYKEILGESFFQLAESVFNCTPAGKLSSLF
uniref:Transferrin-like domain-containing protein n=1 Tax=Nothoprocta perdicaria TaxID=30464 RepID=A0A8C6Z3S0_NOTPE